MATKKSSKVWKYFEKVKDDPKKVKCNLCEQLLTYHTTTTNMAYHLKRLHPQCYDDSSASTSAAPRLTQKRLDLRPPLSEKRKTEITEKIAEFVALDMRPVRTVEGEGFKELLRTLEPGYTVPTRATVMDNVQEDYRAAKCKTCGAQFQRSGEKRKSFYTSIMMSHLRSCHRYDTVWKEYQEAKMLTRNRSVRAGEKKMEENDGKQPGPSTTTLNKEEENGLWTVTCGDKKGLLDISKLRKSVACIKCEGQWFSPPAFEEFGGKKASKKWKVTIYYKDKPLRYWFMKGYLSTKGSYKRSVECLKETTNLPSDLISDHLSDGNSAATTVSKSPARSPGEPGSSSKDSWCQPLDADMLVEEDCPKTNDASSPAVEGPTSPVPDVEEQVKPTQSPKIEVEMREIQCVTESEPSSPATTAPDIPEVIAAEKIQITQVKSESTDADQTKLKISPASDPGVPESPPAPSPPPSAGCDLDTMDLHQLKREKLKMQIKVLRLQEEYYARKLGGPLT